jgi:hypothetical protein
MEKKIDFDILGASLKISEKAIKSIYQKFSKNIQNMVELISESFLDDNFKGQYQELIITRAKKINIF